MPAGALSLERPIEFLADPDNSATMLTARLLFDQVYGGSDQVVFQTCIEAQGNPMWGRIFVTADPIDPSHSIYWGVKLPKLLFGTNALLFMISSIERRT